MKTGVISLVQRLLAFSRRRCPDRAGTDNIFFAGSMWIIFSLLSFSVRTQARHSGTWAMDTSVTGVWATSQPNRLSLYKPAQTSVWDRHANGEQTVNYFAKGEPVAIGETYLRNTIHADTSGTMQKLNKLNGFMEWYMIYFPMPYLAYSKETSWLFGLSKYNAFTMRRHSKRDSTTQASSITGFGYYTLNSQFKAVVESNLMFSGNRAVWKTTFAYIYYPLLYYGVGNDTKLDNERTLNTLNMQLSTMYLRRIWRKWYAGVTYDYFNYYKVELVPETTSVEGDAQILDRAQGRQSGLGVRVSMEGRDNRLNAKHGLYVDASYQFFNKAFGSNFNFQYFQADVRYYFPLFNKVTLASVLRTESRQGDVPVQSLAFLGGDYYMRGSYLGRYRSNVSLMAQTEARFPIFWIFGGTLFGGVGQVATDYVKLNTGSFHANYGFGLRLKVDSVHDVNLRFDMGFTGDQTMFIMNFSEAF